MASSRESGELVGVAGWLAVFIVIIGVISPLRILISTISNLYGDPNVAAAYGEHWAALEGFEWGLSIASIAATCFFAWRMLKVHSWKTVKLVIAGIWTLSIGIQVAETLGVALIGGISLDLLLPDLFPAIFQPVVFCTVWTAYLLRSRRVANTYPRYGDAEEVAGVFG